MVKVCPLAVTVPPSGRPWKLPVTGASRLGLHALPGLAHLRDIAGKGEIHFEDTSRADGGRHVDDSTQAGHYAVDERKTESSAHANFLGGKEGIEDFLQDLRPDAAACVGDFQYHVIPRRDGTRHSNACRADANAVQ